MSTNKIKKNESVKVKKDNISNNSDRSNKFDKSENTKSKYNSDNIVVLEGLDGIRKRPAMYIGSTGKKGMHHLAFEVIDNSIDEAMTNNCSKIEVILEKDGSLIIRDDARGIPVDLHPKKKISTLELVFSSLHSGGKFDKKSYSVSGGLHGVGLAVVNACSEWVIVNVKRNCKKYQVKMGKGHITEHLKVIEDNLDVDDTGTEVIFYPDKEIFTSLDEEEFLFDYEYLETRLRDLAFLNPIKILITDNRGEIRSAVFEYKNGISDFVKYLNEAKKVINPIPVKLHKEKDGIVVDLAFQYNETYTELIQCFVNNINTIEGGTHLSGFKSATTRVFNNFIKNHEKKFKLEKNLSGSDVREGLVAVLAVRVPEPQFEGQTKTKLGNPEVKGVVSSLIYSEMLHYFDTEPKIARQIIHKSLSAQKARFASQKARDLTRRKSALDSLRLPGKLADCSSKIPDDCEIFIVEGDSAGGSAKQGRDRGTQAILPLRGKILNCEKARMNKILGNKEIASMIKAIGVGITIGGELDGEEEENGNSNGSEESNFDLSNLRYDKIVIMCDADVDGHHIETLLLTFFFRYMRPLIDAGHIYLAVPPIYKLSYKKKFKYLYIADEAKLLNKEIDNFAEKHSLRSKSRIKVQRYKGLGEMNPGELWDTTMDPDTRRLHRMVYDDIVSTDHIFATLMGDEVAPRKAYILDHYNQVINLDV